MYEAWELGTHRGRMRSWSLSSAGTVASTLRFAAIAASEKKYINKINRLKHVQDTVKTASNTLFMCACVDKWMSGPGRALDIDTSGGNQNTSDRNQFPWLVVPGRCIMCCCSENDVFKWNNSRSLYNNTIGQCGLGHGSLVECSVCPVLRPSVRLL